MTVNRNIHPRHSTKADRINQTAQLHDWAGLALLSLPTILLGMDITVLHLALPSLVADLGPSSTQTLWIMDIYGFMIAGFLITMGTLGDRIGRRRLLMIGAFAFAMASIAAAYSTSASMLIAARAALGVAGATLMPSTLALISNMFVNPHQRALAIGVWATMFALGMAIGPIVGGIFVERFGWGAAFLVALPVSMAVLLGAPYLLPEYRAPRTGKLDFPSVMISIIAILSLIYSIKQATKYGFAPEIIGPVVLGIVFMALFIGRQRNISSPLFDIRLFNNRAFRTALTVLLVGLIAVGGTMLLITQYLQLVAGMSPFEAGLWMGPPALAMVVSGITAPLLARRIRPAYVVSTALGFSVAGYLMLAGMENNAHALIVIIIGFSLVYLGLGTVAALGTDLVVGAAPAEKAGSASAMSETVQELGISLGIAILGSLSTGIYRSHMLNQVPDTLTGNIRMAVLDSLPAASSVADQVPDDLLDLARNAFTSGFNAAALSSAFSIGVLAILAAISLRHIGIDRREK